MPRSALAAASLVLLLAGWPYTLVFIMPTNKALKAISANEASPTSRALMNRWGRLHAVRTMLDELPSPRDRALLKRFYLEEGEKDSLCREFDLAEGTLNQALNRARARFRAILDQRGLNKSDLLGEAP